MNTQQSNRGMKTFLTIWFGELISIVGSGLTGFALGIWVYRQTGSITLFALISLATVLPGAVVAPVAGVFADRWNRRIIMMIGDFGAGLATLTMALLFMTGRLEIWHIYIGMSISSICTAFQEPAYLSAIPLLLPKDDYARANGMIQAGVGIGRIVSPVMAGVLMQWLKVEQIMMIDFATFLFAITMLSIVRIPTPPASEEGQQGKGSIRGEILQGWRYLRQRPGLLALVGFATIVNFGLGFFVVLIGPMMLSFTTPAMLGIATSVAGLGMLFGSILISAWGGPKRLINGVLASTLICGICVALAGMHTSILLITAAAFIFLFNLPIINSSAQAIWQRKIQPDLQGRVFALNSMLAQLAAPVAYLIAGPLADYVFEPMLKPKGALVDSVGYLIGTGSGRGIGLMLIIMGLFIVFIAAGGYLYPHLRNVENELPDVLNSTAARPGEAPPSTAAPGYVS